MYLLHFPVVALVEYYLPYRGIGVVVLAFLLSAALSAAMHLLIERPIYQLRDRLRGAAITT